jgi:transcriptional regulator NrdR family protein
MDCPHCPSTKTKVLETRAETQQVYRRRFCLGCGKVFVTREYHDAELRIPRKPAPPTEEREPGRKPSFDTTAISRMRWG